MAALTDVARLNLANDGKQTISMEITNGEEVFLGGLLAIAAAGGVRPNDDTASESLVGIAVNFGDGSEDAGGGIPDSVTGDTSAAVPPRVIVDLGEKILDQVDVAGATTLADVGSLVYCATDNLAADCSLTPTTNVEAVGEITKFYSATSYEVLLYSRSTITALN